ncbi:MAG: PEP-CTERM sorting domain-containing protein [Planctomycetaceae bacterium]
MKHCLLIAALLVVMGGSAQAAVLFSNGFETDTAGWNVFGAPFDATRVASGTNGITSASGSWHAESGGGSVNATGAAGNWGGYNFGAGSVPGIPFQEYRTSSQVYLNVTGGFANDTRFDYSSAINEIATGGHRRDFVFNVGFYNSADVTGPGAGTDRFVVSASNGAGRANAFPKNPGRDPIAIDQDGWYTFEHHFYDDGGVLAVDLNIFDDTNSLVGTWTLSDPSDLIGLISGNRYGWFALQEFGVFAFDNTFLETIEAQQVPIPEPTSLAIWGIGGLGMWFGAKRRRQRSQAA